MGILSRTATLVATGVLAFASSVLAAEPASASLKNNLCNGSDYNGTKPGVGLGVIHLKDGNYGHGNYDAILPPGDCTYQLFGWAEAGGWYTGPGFCTYQEKFNPASGKWEYQWPPLGPGIHLIGVTDYVVYPARVCKEP